MLEKMMYVTDDRDLPDEDQRALVIFQGGNGDFYVQVAPKHGRTTEGVRLCTSGGASTNCPGLTGAIADAYRAMRASQSGEGGTFVSRTKLEDEIRAWRTAFPNKEFMFGDIVEKTED
jgi:hypothetical protein